MIYLYTPHILVSPPLEDAILQNTKAMSDKAFLFHRDIDNTLWLKLFVCLSEFVGGDHVFIQGSHWTFKRDIESDYLERKGFCQYFHSPFKAKTVYETHLHTGRFDESALEELYGSSIIPLVARAGDAWLEDTYGIHKGTPPLSGRRIIMSLLIGRLPVRYQ
jgi:hypothetical protein